MTVGSFVGCSDVQCATHGSRSGHARAAQFSTAEKRSVNEQRLSPVRHYARRAHRQMMADWRKKDGSDGRRDFLRICNVFLNRARPSQVSTCTGRTYPLPLPSWFASCSRKDQLSGDSQRTISLICMPSGKAVSRTFRASSAFVANGTKTWIPPTTCSIILCGCTINHRTSP